MRHKLHLLVILGRPNKETQITPTGDFKSCNNETHITLTGDLKSRNNETQIALTGDFEYDFVLLYYRSSLSVVNFRLFL